MVLLPHSLLKVKMLKTEPKVYRYGVISGSLFPVFGPKITPYLDTFHTVKLRRFGKMLSFLSYVKTVYQKTYIDFRKNWRQDNLINHSWCQSLCTACKVLLEACKLLLAKFPLPSILLLNKIQEWDVDTMKAFNVLKQKKIVLEHYHDDWWELLAKRYAVSV